MLDPSRVLVTGASGFVGRAVVAAIPGARALDSRTLDLTDGQLVAAAIAEWRPEVVVHLAARVGGITANIALQADFLIDNLRIDANLMAALRRHPPRHFIPMLSTCMYPDRLDDALYPMDEALIEAGPPPPTNAAYAAAKRALWYGARALHAQYGVPYTALVPANLYGPGDHYGSDNSHFLAAAITRIEAARVAGAPAVSFMGTGRALRQYLLVTDLARLVANVASGPAYNATFNVAPEAIHSIAGLTHAVAGACGYEGAVVFTGVGPDGQHRKDVAMRRLNEAIPAWSAIETPLEEGLSQTVDWYRANVAAR